MNIVIILKKIIQTTGFKILLLKMQKNDCLPFCIVENRMFSKMYRTSELRTGIQCFSCCGNVKSKSAGFIFYRNIKIFDHVSKSLISEN